MIQWIKENTQIDFMAKGHIAVTISGVLIIISILAVAIRGLNLGIDFTGGVLMELSFQKAPVIEDIRHSLAKAGFGDASVQYYGNTTDLLVRMAPRNDIKITHLQEQVVNALRQGQDTQITVQRVESVGAQVGVELFNSAGIALLLTFGGILLYVWMRFERLLAIGAILALIHDPLIIIGVFALFQVEFNLAVVAAILAVIGYSINDTIVVFDRIREVFRKMRKATVLEVMNHSINQTLSRTIMTSFYTLSVAVVLLILGGETLFGFSLALVIGIVVGTYSSIYIASYLAMVFGVSKEDLMLVKKEGEEFKQIP